MTVLLKDHELNRATHRYYDQRMRKAWTEPSARLHILLLFAQRVPGTDSSTVHPPPFHFIRPPCWCSLVQHFDQNKHTDNRSNQTSSWTTKRIDLSPRLARFSVDPPIQHKALAKQLRRHPGTTRCMNPLCLPWGPPPSSRITAWQNLEQSLGSIDASHLGGTSEGQQARPAAAQSSPSPWRKPMMEIEA